MQGYIESDLATFEHKRTLAEEKTREIAIQHGFNVDEHGNIIGTNPDGTPQPDKEVTSALFEICKSLVDDNYYAFSFRDVLPHQHYAAVEDYAGLTLVDIPDAYFTPPPPPVPEE